MILLKDVEEWFFTLDTDDMTTLTGAFDLLEIEGPSLGRPVVDRVKGSRFHSMKELRPPGSSIRILFIFDPLRRAILLLGGDKAGSWKRWYDKNIPVAEARYDNWLENEGASDMARSWREIRADAVAQGRLDPKRAATARAEMQSAVQAHRLAAIRKVLGHARQADVAALMGVSQARVSKLESGDLSHTELGTLQSYVAALGGNLRIVAEFGERTVDLAPW